MENGKVKFIRVNGRVVPIRNNNAIESRKSSNISYSDGSGKGKDSKKVIASANDYKNNLGMKGALSRLVHLKGGVKKDFKKGIQQGLKEDISEGKRDKLISERFALGGALLAMSGLLSKSSGRFGAGLAIAIAGGISSKSNELKQKQSKKELKNLDKNIKKTERSWNSFWLAVDKQKSKKMVKNK